MNKDFNKEGSPPRAPLDITPGYNSKYFMPLGMPNVSCENHKSG